MSFLRHDCILWCAFALSVHSGSASAEIRLSPGTTVKFAAVKEGKDVLGAVDSYLTAMSALDREIRLKSEERVTQDEYLSHVASQVMAWPDDEIAKLRTLIEAAREKLSWVKAALPREILLVRTTNQVEGGAPHVRGASIVFPQGSLDGPATLSEQIFLHELFHVIVKENPKMREPLYRIVGFQTIPEIKLPPTLRPRKLTNPDAPRHEVVIDVTYNGETVTAAPILLSNVDQYDKNDDRRFPMGYVDFKLMQVERQEGDWSPRLVQGEPVLMAPMSVSGFLEKIGRNTQYIIHPEEVLADNFAFVVMGRTNLPSPEITSALRKLLSK